MALMAFPAFAQDGKTGAGDDQQVPDNQQGGGGGDLVTKTFELTINGTVPADAAFIVGYVEEGQDPDTEGHFVILCGDLSQLPEEELEGIPDEDIISDEGCVGDGAVQSFEREFAQGTSLAFFFARASVTDEEVFEIFFTSLQDPNIEDDQPLEPGDFETLDTDFTNTAFFTFGTGDDKQDDAQDDGAGAGDDQQDGEDKDSGAGAGDDQQTPDNQQDDTQDDGTGAGDEQDDTQDDGSGAGDKQDDTQDDGSGAGDEQDDTQDDGTGAGDDQQGEMPEELPETGAGGLSPGATIPMGNAAAGLTGLLGAGYAVLRRR